MKVDLPSEATKVDFNPFKEEEFVAVLDDYIVRINTNKKYECLFFGQ
jgi:hypothetical protein